MNAFLSLLPTLLQALASTAGNILSPHISGILTTVSALVQQGEDAFPKFEALTNHVLTLAKGGTDPTTAQVSTLNAHLTAAADPTAPIPSIGS
jgi:hypothetical protein